MCGFEGFCHIHEVVTHLFTVEQFERNLPGARLMHTTGFPVCPHVSKPRIVLNWCEMFVG